MRRKEIEKRIECILNDPVNVTIKEKIIKLADYFMGERENTIHKIIDIILVYKDKEI